MKKIISIAVLLLIWIANTSAQTDQKKMNPVGTWKFEAPAAPEGYASGVITVAITEKQHSATISFTGNECKIPGEKVRVANDSLLFSVNLEGESVKMFLRMTPGNKMTGKAVYSEGEVPLSLTRETASLK